MLIDRRKASTRSHGVHGGNTEAIMNNFFFYRVDKGLLSETPWTPCLRVSCSYFLGGLRVRWTTTAATMSTAVRKKRLVLLVTPDEVWQKPRR
jgi:hypothetical protein